MMRTGMLLAFFLIGCTGAPVQPSEPSVARSAPETSSAKASAPQARPRAWEPRGPAKQDGDCFKGNYCVSALATGPGELGGSAEAECPRQTGPVRGVLLPPTHLASFDPQLTAVERHEHRYACCYAWFETVCKNPGPAPKKLLPPARPLPARVQAPLGAPAGRLLDRVGLQVHGDGA